MPSTVKGKRYGLSTEWGRSGVPFVLREMSREWTVKRTCVFVCGPPNVRADFSNIVAGMEELVWEMEDCEEIRKLCASVSPCK